MAYYHLMLFVPRAQEVRAALGFGTGYSFGADFYPIWFTAREGLLHHRDPYSPEMTREIQIGLFGRPLDAQNPAAPIDYRTSLIRPLPTVCSGPQQSCPFPLCVLFWRSFLPR